MAETLDKILSDEWKSGPFRAWLVAARGIFGGLAVLSSGYRAAQLWSHGVAPPDAMSTSAEWDETRSMK